MVAWADALLGRSAATPAVPLVASRLALSLVATRYQLILIVILTVIRTTVDIVWNGLVVDLLLRVIVICCIGCVATC